MFNMCEIDQHIKQCRLDIMYNCLVRSPKLFFNCANPETFAVIVMCASPLIYLYAIETYAGKFSKLYVDLTSKTAVMT